MPRRILAVLGVCLMTSPAVAQVTGPTPFGKTADGTAVETYTLKNKNGMSVKLMTLGATIMEINVADKQGKFANVVFGFDDVAGYESDRNQYFGCTVGRVCNRIAKGKFTLDGKEYKLAINNDPNHLHGGVKRSLDKVVWKGQILRLREEVYPRIVFRYKSPDGEEGYPGNVEFTVDYVLDDSNELSIRFRAATDKPTPVNLTNHSYFNLAGAGADTVLDHELALSADGYVPVDKTLIPTGKLEPVKGTIFDFTKATRIGARIEKLYDTGAKGYDHCYVVRPPLGKDPRPPVGRLYDPKSGRALVVSTSQPGIQVYTGNFLKGQKGAGGKEYKQRSGICLETCHFPDAVNQPAFLPIIVRPNMPYDQRCAYRFSAD